MSNSYAFEHNLIGVASRYGNDGLWNPFQIGIGTPPQYVKLLISTTATQPNAVVPQACNSTLPATCPYDRGGLLNKNSSSTWKDAGLYSLSIEQNLGNRATGDFGWDNITFGLPGSQAGNIALPNQLVAGIVNKDFFLANWGIRPDETNLTTMNNRYPSVIENLKNSSYIPSKSWGYTAGAYYRSQVSKSGFASLTLGGFDSDRYVAHNTTFNFAADVARDLVVGIQSITANTTSQNLLGAPIKAFLDSGIPHIWLPEIACDAFQSAFNLTYNSTNGFYFVNDTVHSALLEQNPNITFTLTNDLTSKAPAINISLPYAAFDLALTTNYPGVTTNNTRYFPLRQAANESQYTLGRTFFQEAYIVADYERSKFSVHQALFPDSQQQSLQAIAPLPGTEPTNSTSTVPHLTTGAIAAISVTLPVTFLAILALLYFTRRRWLPRIRQWRKLEQPEESSQIQTPELHEDTITPPSEVSGLSKLPPEILGGEKTAELDDEAYIREVHGTDPAKELEAGLVYELPGSDVPSLAEENRTMDTTRDSTAKDQTFTGQDITDCTKKETQTSSEPDETDTKDQQRVSGLSHDTVQTLAASEISWTWREWRLPSIFRKLRKDYQLPEEERTSQG